jgi:hypothetical protein
MGWLLWPGYEYCWPEIVLTFWTRTEEVKW